VAEHFAGRFDFLSRPTPGRERDSLEISCPPLSTRSITTPIPGA
jgi:hypothetical protein